MQQQYYQLPKPPPPPPKWFKSVVEILAEAVPTATQTPTTVTPTEPTTTEPIVDQTGVTTTPTVINNPITAVEVPSAGFTPASEPEFTDNLDLSYKIMSIPAGNDSRPLRSYNWSAKQPIPGIWSLQRYDTIPKQFITDHNQIINIQVAWTVYVIWMQLKPKSQPVNIVNAQLEFDMWYEWLLLKRFNPSVTALLNWFAERENEPRKVYQISSMEELKRMLGYTGPVICTCGIVLTSVTIKGELFSGYCGKISQDEYTPSDVIVTTPLTGHYCYIAK